MHPIGSWGQLDELTLISRRVAHPGIGAHVDSSLAGAQTREPGSSGKTADKAASRPSWSLMTHLRSAGKREGRH